MRPKDYLLGDVSEHALTEYTDHVARWQNCKLCPLHSSRNEIVLYRGHLPADYLFVGEAPGGDENERGIPFIGAAGHTLQSAIDLLSSEIKGLDLPDFRYGITNIVACFPGRSSIGFNKPTDSQAAKCRNRLEEMVEIVSPKMVILLGKVSEQYANRINGLRTIALYHPSYILRQGGVGSQAFRSWYNELSKKVMKDYAKA